MPMADYAAKEIFKPLGMTHTHFHTDHTQIVKNRASGYVPDGKGYKICMTTLGLIGDGGVFTTINDIKKWDDAYYKSDVLSRRFWNMMTERGLLNNGDTLEYASGLMVSTHKGLKTISHGGAFVGYRTQLLRFPDQHFSVAILANRADANPSRMAYKVADVFLSDQYKTNPKASPKKEDKKLNTKPDVTFTLQQLTGTFSIEPGVDMRLEIKDDSLNITQLWNNSSYNVVAVNGNTYQIPGEASIKFTFSELKDGMVQVMTIFQNGGEAVCKRKKEIDLSDVNIEEYTGMYYSAELDATYHISAKDDILTIKIRNTELSDLLTYDIDQYSSNFAMFRFTRKDGKISGFLLDAGRVKNLAFEKK